MDRNLLLAFALSMAVFLAWTAWQEEIRAPERQAALEAQEQQKQEPTPAKIKGPKTNEPVSPVASVREQVPKQVSPPTEAVEESSKAVAPWSGVLENDVMRVELSNRGGSIEALRMKQFFETPRHEVPIEMIDVPDTVSPTLGTIFVASENEDLSEARYEVERADSQEVSMVLRRGNLEVRKIYQKPNDEYEMEFVIEVTNRGSAAMNSGFSILVPSATNDRTDFQELSLVALVDDEVTREMLPSVGGGSFFGGLFGGHEGPFEARRNVGWAGIDLRYFAGVVIPADPTDVGVSFVPLVEGTIAVARIDQHGARLAPGETISRRYSAFFGPKEPALLERLGRDLDQTINRGWSWVEPLTVFFEWALSMVHRVIPNYGLVIIVLTLLVRLVTLPIIAKQMKSSERMRDLMPRIKELQAKYKDDKQKQSEETFKLYREEGVNPLSGCFPLLLQMPVFIGLFYALQTSFDLRQAPFVLWINDLSTPATLFMLPGLDFPVRILPFIMAGSMVVQQQMTPQTGMDPAQAKMMMIMMPGIMLLFSYTFPSGLVLYWTVSNLLGIGHQLLVRRRMHAKAEAA